VKEIHRVVGVSCVGFVEQFLAILTAIEVEAHHSHRARPLVLNKGTMAVGS
jgi:hypothetical protein